MEKDFLSKNYTWQGVVLIIVGVLSAIVGVGVLLIILGIIFLVADKVILHIDKDHLTFKAAPLAGKKFVLFTDIEEAVYSPKKIMLILNTGKKLRILKTNFTPEDWEEINTFFKSIKPPKEE